MQLGELRQARSEFEAIPALYDPERDRDLAAHCVTDPRASGLSFLALVLWMMGLPDQARRTADEAARHSAALQHANTTGHVLCHGGGELAMLLHDVPSVRRCGEAVTTLAAEHDMPMWRGYGLVLQGWAAAEEGQLEEGLSACEPRASRSWMHSALSFTGPIILVPSPRSTPASATRTRVGGCWRRPTRR